MNTHSLDEVVLRYNDTVSFAMTGGPGQHQQQYQEHCPRPALKRGTLRPRPAPKRGVLHSARPQHRQVGEVLHTAEVLATGSVCVCVFVE